MLLGHLALLERDQRRDAANAEARRDRRLLELGRRVRGSSYFTLPPESVGN
jgi:hypothetical protein